MIPDSLIFTETASVARARERAHATAGRLLAFIGIGAGLGLVYVLLEQGLVSAFPSVVPLQIQILLFASLLVPGYQLHRRVCFASEMPHLRAAMRYVTLQLGVLCLAGFFSQLAYGVVGMPQMTTVFLVFAVTAGVNFTVLRNWAFSSL